MIKNENNWYARYQDDYLGKDDKDAPGEILTDFDAKENELSFYIVDDERSNLERIIAAMAANRSPSTKFDYALFSPEVFDQVGLALKKTPAETADSGLSEFHRSATKLTISKLAKLAIAVWHSPSLETQKVLKDDVDMFIVKSVKQNHIKLEKVREKKMFEHISSLLQK